MHARDLIFLWIQLAEVYNIVTPAQRSAARKQFLNFMVIEDERFLDIKQRYYELLRKVIVQGVIDVADRLETLFNALPEKFDFFRESYFAHTPAPEIEYVWDKMFDMETTEKRRAAQSGA